MWVLSRASNQGSITGRLKCQDNCVYSISVNTKCIYPASQWMLMVFMPTFPQVPQGELHGKEYCVDSTHITCYLKNPRSRAHRLFSPTSRPNSVTRTIVISSKMMSVARTFRSDPGRFRGVRHDGQGSRPGAIISDRTGPGAGSAMTARQQASGGDWKLRLRICGTRSAPDTRFPRTLDIHFLGTVPAWPTNSSSPTFFRDLGCAKDI